MLAFSPRWLLGAEGIPDNRAGTVSETHALLKGGVTLGSTAIASTFLAHFIPAPKPKSGLQFLVYLKVPGAQISKWGIRNVQSLFEDFLEFGVL